MSIDAVTTTETRASGTPARASATPAATGTIGSDFETFLKMLTVQMQNQDPMNPMESSDFAAQLATFAGVEQQTKTNQLLQDLGDRLGLGALAQAADWVGKEVLVAAPVALGQGPLDLTIDPAGQPADAAELVVRDENGRWLGQNSGGPCRRDLALGGGRHGWNPAARPALQFRR